MTDDHRTVKRAAGRAFIVAMHVGLFVLLAFAADPWWLGPLVIVMAYAFVAALVKAMQWAAL